jgi:flagellar motor switch protein FliG
MAEKEIPNMAENETTNGGSLTNEEIDVLLENIDEKISQEEKRPSDPFNKIVKLDDRAIQKVIQKTDGKDLAKALKPAGLRVQNKYSEI